MTDAKARILSPRKAYLLSLPLVALTTWGLLLLQEIVIHLEGGNVRPFGVGFLLTVALVTILGGRGPGLITLLISCVSLMFYLTPLGAHGKTGRPRDLAELALLLSVGTVLIRGLETLHKNAVLLAESEEARARLRAIMDTAPVAVLLSELSGKLIYANREAERIWGQPLELEGPGNVKNLKMLNSDGTPTAPEQTGLARVLAGEAEIIHTERVIEHTDGTRVFVESRSTLVRDDTGRPLSGLVVFSDITERKSVEQEVVRLLARERLINRIGQISLQTLDPDLIQREAAAGLKDLLRADRCYFTLYDSEKTLHTPGQTLVVADSQDETLPITLRGTLLSDGTRSAITTPLFDGGHLVATLTVAMDKAPRAWLPEETALVEAVAAQTRAALEAARAQQRERTIALALQDALVPEVPNRAPGLEMASYYKAALDEAKVGGDFLDVFALGNGLAVFAVGDLSGKGLAAASQVATVRNMLRYSLYRTERLDQAIAELNHTLVAHELLTGFATLFVGIYDQRTRLLTYLSCGHDPGLLRRAQTHEIELLPVAGTDVSPVLGMVEDGLFVQNTVTLELGDVLFFCTDGVTEAGRSRGEFLGVAGVAEMLRSGEPNEAVEDLVARIVSEVREYAQGILHDDVCLLAAVVRA